MSLIRLEQIQKSYGPDPVLRSVNLTVEPGELLAICGPSGSGKSTLMNLLGLLDRADSGKYYFCEQETSQLDSDRLAKIRNQDLGFVFQQFHLLPRMNALDNVMLPLQYQRHKDQSMESRAIAALAQVDLADFAKRRPQELSGGQQQRVAIARALVSKPKLILADEPTGSLDSVTGKAVMQLFLDLHQQGHSLIIITHDLNIAKACPRQVHIADGQILSDSGIIG